MDEEKALEMLTAAVAKARAADQEAGDIIAISIDGMMGSLADAGERINAAVEVLAQYGGIDGAHHKDWVIDQALRALFGDEGYSAFRAKAEADDCDYDEGIAP